MGIFNRTPPPTCPSARHCAQWAQAYLKYCLCSTKDGIALGLGLASVLSWGVAEVPQIITNYKQKSTEGLSIAFLMTWVVGDLFNLVGCFLEPATLPTQFYMALLYTITTLILTGQTIYYTHIYRLKVKKTGATGKPQKHQRGDASLREKLLAQRDDASKNNIQSGVTIPVPSSPIQVNTEVFLQRHSALSPSSDYYYVSARSLSRSPVPIAGTWLGNNRQTTRAQMNDHGESGEFAPAQSAPAAITKNSLAVVPWISVLLGMCVLHILVGSAQHSGATNETIIPVGRKLLHLADDHADIESGIGTFLGWAMAVIYMGGRLPQIYLNMQRGHAEGLNPLMFTFALVGNTTYVGSILVNSLDWAKLKPNLPWLVDAGGCVLLDSLFFSSFISIIGSAVSAMKLTLWIKPNASQHSISIFFSEKDLRLPACIQLSLVSEMPWCILLGSLSCARAKPRAELQRRSSNAWLAVNEQRRQMRPVAGRKPVGRHTISVYHMVICLWFWGISVFCFEVCVYNLVVIIGC